MKLSEEQLRSAAILAREKELAQFNQYGAGDEHSFSEEFDASVQDLLAQLAQGTVKAKPVRMGWQYYAKGGVAAVLVVFLLSCAAIPEAVMAGYEKIVEMIETIETIFDEFTEYRFAPNEYEKKDFVAAKLEYLPEGMMEIKSEIDLNGNLYSKYEDDQYYFRIKQAILSQDKNMVYISDTEEAQVEKMETINGTVTIYEKNGQYQYVLQYQSSLITGDTNLPYGELKKILQNISL